jgi:hypothetical protein
VGENMSFVEALAGLGNFPTLPLSLKGSSDKFEVLALKGQETVGTSTSEFAFGKEKIPDFQLVLSAQAGDFWWYTHTHTCTY